VRFLQTADWHIGKSRNLPGYLDRQEQMARQIFEIASKEGVDALLIAGDIYDHPDLYDIERNLFLGLLLEYDDSLGIPVIIINGNHCMIGRGDSTALHYLKILEEQKRFLNAKIVELEPEIFTIASLGHFVLIPYNYYASVSFKLAVEKELNKIQDNLPIIVACHECINGAVTDTGWRASHRFLDIPSNSKVTYWALGDVHKRQSIQPNAWYSGSPIQHTFGDAPNDKGVLIVDTDDPTNPKYIELQGIKPLLTLTEVPDKWPDAYVRIIGLKEVPRNLPDNVIYTTSDIAPEASIKAEVIAPVDNLLEGLPEILVTRGVNSKDQKEAIAMATEALKHVKAI
jgi:DNA repair protein SbcD/Mre11